MADSERDCRGLLLHERGARGHITKREKKRMRFRASADFNNLQSLEDDLGCELHVEGFTGTDTRGAVEVADGVAYETVAADRAAAGGKVDPVEQVKHLRPELYFQALANRNVLEHRKIQVARGESSW